MTEPPSSAWLAYLRLVALRTAHTKACARHRTFPLYLRNPGNVARRRQAAADCWARMAEINAAHVECRALRKIAMNRSAAA